MSSNKPTASEGGQFQSHLTKHNITHVEAARILECSRGHVIDLLARDRLPRPLAFAIALCNTAGISLREVPSLGGEV